MNNKKGGKTAKIIAHSRLVDHKYKGISTKQKVTSQKLKIKKQKPTKEEYEWTCIQVCRGVCMGAVWPAVTGTWWGMYVAGDFFS